MSGSLSFTVRKIPSGQGSIQINYRKGFEVDVRMSSGKKINNVTNWNKEKQRVKNVVAEPKATFLNHWLTKKQLEIEQTISNYELDQNELTNNKVASILRIALGKANKSDLILTSNKEFKVLNLKECYSWYVDYFSENPTPTTQKPLAKSSIKTFKTTKKTFFEFIESSKDYDYHDIDMAFYEKFTSWLKAKDYSRNYIGSHIKNLKTVLNYAFSRDFHNNLIFKKREFAKPKEEVDAIFLNTEELKAISKLDLSFSKSLTHSRDLFLIGAYTGLRISDLNSLLLNNIVTIQKKKFIQIKPKKTGDLITIPINSIVDKILEKYDGKPPPPKLDQQINKDLKIIGEKAEINDTIRISKTKGGITKELPYSKYDLISCHTARRSFCTNAYKAGIPTYDIMMISGHKTERVFYNYIKTTNQEKALKISTHKFFK